MQSTSIWYLERPAFENDPTCTASTPTRKWPGIQDQPEKELLNGMKIGYARVSTQDQNLEFQRDALGAAGCERIFEDKDSGAKVDRPALAEALAFARPGDALVVWRLDRLCRSLPDLVRIVGEFGASQDRL